eukprot:10259380-Alexandrium_andersonii.AAC.1
MLPTEATGCFPLASLHHHSWPRAGMIRGCTGQELEHNYILEQAFEWRERKLFASLTVHTRVP